MAATNIGVANICVANATNVQTPERVPSRYVAMSRGRRNPSMPVLDGKSMSVPRYGGHSPLAAANPEWPLGLSAGDLATWLAREHDYSDVTFACILHRPRAE